MSNPASDGVDRIARYHPVRQLSAAQWFSYSSGKWRKSMTAASSAAISAISGYSSSMGERRLCPILLAEPYTNHLMRNGVTIDYHQPDGEHNTRWWPELKDPFEQFVAAHPRSPHPDKLTSDAAEDKGRPAFNRAHLLPIDDFGPLPGRRENRDGPQHCQQSEQKSFPTPAACCSAALKPRAMWNWSTPATRCKQ
jgi:hypothetical protein